MRMRHRRLAPSAMWVATLLLGGAAVSSALLGADGIDTGEEVVTAVVFFSIILVFSTVGLLVAFKAPKNRMGWVFMSAGLLWGMYLATASYMQVAPARGFPGLAYAAWINSAVYFPAILALVSLPLLLFPDGRVPSPAWRWVSGAIATTITLLAVSSTIQPMYEVELANGSAIAVEGPFGVDAAAGFLDSTALNAVAQTMLGLALLGPVAAMIYRFVRSRGVERLQLKWLAFSASIAGIGLAAFYAVEGTVDATVWYVEIMVPAALLGIIGIPITAGLAIVRYRLYDIDRLISRTITYSFLVALLAGVYAAGVFLVGTFATDDAVGVALATLAVAALFNPLRRHLQAVIDRRFSRTGYDTQKVLDRFSQRVADQVDVDALVDNLLDVVDETVVPESAAVWVRQSGNAAT